mmetsp:Transcript_15122/g.47505  ORF Transcript_15122/g.47505 Transcript_15122/m.47505 type:complete len:219 (+) Transcript_15122:130-786(+)
MHLRVRGGRVRSGAAEVRVGAARAVDVVEVLAAAADRRSDYSKRRLGKRRRLATAPTTAAPAKTAALGRGDCRAVRGALVPGDAGGDCRGVRARLHLEGGRLRRASAAPHRQFAPAPRRAHRRTMAAAADAGERRGKARALERDHLGRLGVRRGPPLDALDHHARRSLHDVPAPDALRGRRRRRGHGLDAAAPLALARDLPDRLLAPSRPTDQLVHQG